MDTLEQCVLMWSSTCCSQTDQGLWLCPVWK